MLSRSTMTSLEPAQLTPMANALRALAMDAVEKAKSGHPGMPMGMADVATVLFATALKFDAAAPDWPDRDRFVLSAGHGSMLLYALLHLTGYEDMTLDQLKAFRQLGSKTAGHPEAGHAGGIETTTGPLGQGLATAVGMALAEAHLRARFGEDLVDHRTYVIASDGDLMEGVSHEALSLAGHLRLDRLIVLFDDNGISIDGPTSLAVSDDQCARAEACGWRAERIDGHDMGAIEAALARARASDRPSLIACKTVIGKGAPTKAGKASSHGSPLGAEEIEGAKKALGWTSAPFEVPDELARAWRAIGAKGADVRASWEQRLAASDDSRREAFQAALAGTLPADLSDEIAAYKKRLSDERPAWATRKASQEALEVITPLIPHLVGGSADLTGSNNTKTAATKPIAPGSYGDRYVHYGVREHGMMAAMNGMALHRGVIPYGGTFLVFSDYARPALRLAALMGQRVIFVGTHDSIGLGEDGPTHQPVEHLTALRAIPNLAVFRPADAIETVECWELALANRSGPSVMVLTRQACPLIRPDHDQNNLCQRGAYAVTAASGAEATLLATGSEVALALAAADMLGTRHKIPCNVVSMPCWELFEKQDVGYRMALLGDMPRFAVEAASPFGWTRYVSSEKHVIGMTGFGASAPAEALFENFGITAERVAERVQQLV
ncbi:MAG: transketolase [Geminicoccaceae bacterium]